MFYNKQHNNIVHSFVYPCHVFMLNIRVILFFGLNTVYPIMQNIQGLSSPDIHISPSL